MGPKKTPNYYFNRILMARMQNKYRSFILVEGETDEAFWSEYISEKDCKLERADGKPQIMGLLSSNRLRDLPGIGAVVDADYWLICQSDELKTENLLYDEHFPDSELILLNSPSLKRILRNTFTSYESDRVYEFEEHLTGQTFQCAMEFGYFRLLNYLENYRIDFKKFWRDNGNYLDRFLDNVADEMVFEFNREQFSISLKESCPWIKDIDLLEEVYRLKEIFRSPDIKLCQGKDTLRILVHIFPVLFRAKFGKDLSPSIRDGFRFMELSTKLRSSYDSRYFRKTSLFQQIDNWEKSSKRKYRLLAEDI